MADYSVSVEDSLTIVELYPSASGSDAVDDTSRYYSFNPRYVTKTDLVKANDIEFPLVTPLILNKNEFGEPLEEKILVKDKVPIIGTDIFPYAPVEPSDIANSPYFIAQISFLDNFFSEFVTYGTDITLKHTSFDHVILAKGKLSEELILEKSLGDDLYGSIVFPSFNITVSNFNGEYNFLLTNPEYVYSGVINILLWNPKNKNINPATLAETIGPGFTSEYSGVITGFQYSDKETITFSISPIGIDAFDKTVPDSPSSGEFNFYNFSSESKVLGKHYGRCLNVPCANILKQDEPTPLYHYWAGYGKTYVTKVRAVSPDGILDEILHRDEAVALNPDSTDGWRAVYDPSGDYTYIEFLLPQKEADGSYTLISADIEDLSCKTPSNLLSYSEEIESQSSGVGTLSFTDSPTDFNISALSVTSGSASKWVYNSSYTKILGNVCYGPDSRLSATYVTRFINSLVPISNDYGSSVNTWVGQNFLKPIAIYNTESTDPSLNIETSDLSDLYLNYESGITLPNYSHEYLNRGEYGIACLCWTKIPNEEEKFQIKNRDINAVFNDDPAVNDFSIQFRIVNEYYASGQFANDEVAPDIGNGSWLYGDVPDSNEAGNSNAVTAQVKLETSYVAPSGWELRYSSYTDPILKRTLGFATSNLFYTRDIAVRFKIPYGRLIANPIVWYVQDNDSTVDRYLHYYQKTRQVHKRELGSTNFAINVKDILTTTKSYGVGQLNINNRSFRQAANFIERSGMRCDGPLNQENSPTDLVSVINDLMSPGGGFLERKTNFLEWKYSVNKFNNTPVLLLGLNDPEELNNIVDIPVFESQPVQFYPKLVSVNSDPVRNADGSVRNYRRRGVKVDTDADYGKNIEIINRFFRYHRTADIYAHHLLKTLQSQKLAGSVSTNDLDAWNLNLGDTIQITYPDAGINSLKFQVTGLLKSTSKVTIQFRSSSYPVDNSKIDYTGNYPRDNFGDILDDEIVAGGSEGGSTVGGLADTVEPGTGFLPPGDGFARVYVRKTSGAKGQELVAFFADGSEVILARSLGGSPGSRNSIKIIEEKIWKNTDDIFPEFKLTPALNYSYIEPTYPAIINSTLRPSVSTYGSLKDPTYISTSNPTYQAPTEWGSVNVYTNDQIFVGMVEDAGKKATISYELSLDNSSQVCIVSQDVANYFKVFNSKGSYINSKKSLTNASVARMHRNPSSNEPFVYILDRYNSFDITGSNNIFSYEIRVGKYNRYGSPLASYAIKGIDFSNPEFGTTVTNLIDNPRHPTSSNMCQPCMDIDASGTPWICYNDGSISYLINLGENTITPGKEFSAAVSCQQIGIGGVPTAMCIDRDTEEVHIAVGTSVKTFSLINGTFDNTREYQIPESAVTLSYKDGDGKIYASLAGGGAIVYSAGNPSQILNGSPSVITGSKITDILCHEDEWVYYLYQNTVGPTYTIKLAKVFCKRFENSGFLESSDLNTNVYSLSNDAPSFLCLGPAFPIDTAQELS